MSYYRITQPTITCSKLTIETLKKSALKNFFVSYDIFTIFTAVKYREVPCEAKIQHRYNVTASLKTTPSKQLFIILLRTTEDIRGAAERLLHFFLRSLTSNIVRKQVQ